MLKKFLFGFFLVGLIFSFAGKSFAAEMEMVSYSALVKLQWLASTGQPDAQKVLKALGRGNIYNRENLKDFDRIEKVNGIYQELLYASSVEYVNNKKVEYVIDIAGGFSPRAMVFVNEGKKYFGAELAAVALNAGQIMPNLIKSEYRKNLFYDEVLVDDRTAFFDAVNSVFMGKTAKEVSGEQVRFVEQGLMIYLTKDSTEKMYKNVHDILKIYGGHYVTSDFVSKDLFMEIATAIYGESEAQVIFDETKKMYENLLGDKLNDNQFKTEGEAIKFLNNINLKVKPIKLMNDPSTLYCTKKLTPEQAEKINQIAQKKYLWLIRA